MMTEKTAKKIFNLNMTSDNGYIRVFRNGKKVCFACFNDDFRMSTDITIVNALKLSEGINRIVAEIEAEEKEEASHEDI